MLSALDDARMKFGYVIAYVPDVAATVQFYEDAFGLVRRFVHESGNYAEMETGSTALAFAAENFVRDNGIDFEPQASEKSPAPLEIGLIADDVPAAVERAVGAGAVLVKAPEVKPWGQTVAYVRDANGFLVEICTLVIL